jgi:hypothetical protein
MHIKKLPAELLIKIFSLVSNVDIYTVLVSIPSVNRKWRYICMYYLNDVDINISQLTKINNKKLFLYKFLYKINGIKSIYFNCFFDLKCEFWSLFKDKFYHLKYIDFTNFTRHNYGVTFDLVKFVPNLETIVFSSFMWIKILEINKLKNLKKIKIPYNSRVDFDDYKNIFSSKLNTLEILDLKDCRYLAVDSLKLIAQNCPKLTELDIRGCENCLDRELLNNYFNNLISYKCSCDDDDVFDILITKNILHIYLEEYNYLGTIYDIKGCNYKLKSLTLIESNVNNNFLDKLTNICPNIEEFIIIECSDIILESLTFKHTVINI